MAIEHARQIGLAIAVSLLLASGAAMAQLAPNQPRPGATPGDDFTRGLGSAAPRDVTAGPRSAPIWSFGVTGRLEFSDNIFLAPPGDERDGILLEVSPYLRGEINRPRLQASVDYALRNFYTSPDVGYEGPVHDLRALGNVALKDDWFWLAGQALVYEVNASPFDASSSDPASREGNRTGYRRFDISPYVRGRLGAQTTYEAGYAFNAIRYGGDQFDSVAHQVRGELLRSPALNRFGYQLRADTSRREFDGGADYDTANAQILGLYRVSHSLTVGAGADYTRINVVRSDDGETGGWGPAVFLNWAPSPRTQLQLYAAHAYYGDYGTAALSHRAANWTFSLQYDQGIIDGSEAGLVRAGGYGLSQPGRYTDPANPVADELGNRGTVPGFGAPLASGLLGSALVDRRRLSATLGWVRLRNSAALTLFTSRSDEVTTTEPLPSAIGGYTDLDQHGALLRFDRRLSPQTTGTLQGAFTHSETVASALESDLIVFDAILRRTFSQSTSASIGYRWSEQRGSGRYRENAILIALYYRL